MSSMEREWHGDDIMRHINRAGGRAIIAIGENVAEQTKRVTHVVTGTLRRSVHAAELGYEPVDDERLAADADDGGLEEDLQVFLGLPHATLTAMGPAIEVGSWMPYACVEWIGRGHPGITQGMEAVRGHLTDSIVRQAFLEEGLL